MAFSTTTERNIALKKLLGKAHTSNDKGASNESLPSNITLGSNTVFGESIPTTSISSSLWDITNSVVERVQLTASFIAGTDTVSGRHGFQLSLPSTYTTLSSNPKKGTGKFVNGGVVQSSAGGLQLVPTSFASAYEASMYYGSPGSLTQIPVLDARDWNLDYFNGVFFQQDPPGTGDHAENPTIVNAYLYIGDYLDSVVSSSTGTVSAVTNGSNNRIATFASADSLNGEANLTFDGSVLSIQGGVIHKRRQISTNITASSSDYFLGISASSDLGIRLPDASTLTAGQMFVIKDEEGAAGTHSIAVNATSPQTIDGAATIALSSPYAAIHIYTDGTSKYFIF